MRTFGRYRLMEPLASGGMAEVWRAVASGPAGVEKEVALKLVRGEHPAASAFARMLVEEARLAARLTHANVVQVFELVEEGGRHAIAMELVRGHDLGKVVERCRQAGVRLGLPRALHVCVEVARALDYAHRRAEGGRPLGLVHRDVSPANVLLSMEGEVKLADFGIARAMSQARLTDPGTLKGKLAYMAPEQARGGAVDARADVFALGVVCWELCAGRRLFARDAEAATLAAVLDEAPVSPPSAWNEAVPPELDAALLAALARDPAARTGTAAELGAALSMVLLRLARAPEDVDLRRLMRRLWPEAPPVPLAAEPTAVRPAPGPAAPAAPEAPPAAALAEATRTVAAPTPRRRRAAALLALGAALAVLVGVAARPGRRLPPPAPGPALAAPPLPGSPAGPGPDPAASGPVLEVTPGADEAAAARGEGWVTVAVHPWATVLVDGQAVGETPRALRLSAGPHRLRAVHPAIGAADLEVVVEPGRRLTWRPALTR